MAGIFGLPFGMPFPSAVAQATRNIPGLLERAKNIARVFAGQWLEYRDWGTTTTHTGRVVGYRPDTASIAFEVILDGADALVTQVVTTAPLTVGKLIDPTGTFKGDPKFQYCDAERVTADPITPKTKRLLILPHKCNRCGFRALIMARTVDCSNWQCPNFYMKS